MAAFHTISVSSNTDDWQVILVVSLWQGDTICWWCGTPWCGTPYVDMWGYHQLDQSWSADPEVAVKRWHQFQDQDQQQESAAGQVWVNILIGCEKSLHSIVYKFIKIFFLLKFRVVATSDLKAYIMGRAHWTKVPRWGVKQPIGMKAYSFCGVTPI